MTELRKKILNSIYFRQEKTINNQMNINKKLLELLKEKVEFFEKEKEIVIKYNIYADDEVLSDFRRIKNEYNLLNIDKKIYYITNSILTFFALFSLNKGYGVEGYCTINLINEFINYTLNKRGENYNPRRYKLIKKSYKSYLKEFNIENSYYDINDILDDLNNQQGYLYDDIRENNDKIKQLNRELEQLKILLFNSKVEYINGKLKQVVHNNYSSIISRNQSFLPNHLRDSKIKTLKNKIIIR